MSRQTKVRTPKEIEQIFNVLRVIVAIYIRTFCHDAPLW